MFYRSCILALIVTAVLAASEHRGTVTSAGLPIPGAVVTAVQGDRKLITSTDESGAYLFEDLSPGAWAIRIEAFGFEIAGKAVNLPADAAATWDLKLKLTSAKPAAAPEEAARHAAAAEAPKRAVSAQAAKATAPGNGSASFQRLAVNQTVQNDVLASLSEPMPDTPQAELSQNATESFLVTGSLSRGLQAPRQDDPGFGPGGFGGPFGMMGGQPGAQPGGAPPDGGGPQPGMGPGMRGGGPGMGGPGMMGGGRGPGGFGGGRGGFGGRGQRAAAGRGGPQRPDWQRRAGAMTFGNRSNRGRDSFRGSAFFTLRNSAFDARSYSLTGQTIDKPSYAQARFGLTGGGQLRIPKLFHSDKTFFFVNYFGTRSRNPFNAVSTLPSALERGGDFSQSIARGPVTVYDPTNSQPFAANLIPASRINSAAAGLLAYFPLPNLPGAVQNYQFNTSVPQNTDNFSLRMFHTLSRRDRIGGSFNLQSRGSQTAQMYGFRDTQSGRGQSLDLSWTRNIRPTLINSLRWNFSRNTSNTDPFFAYGVNVAAALGISGTSNEPRNYGPPNLSFTNFGALSDASAALMRNQSSVLGDGFTFIHGSNTLTVGVEYRRTQLNNRSDQNGRGTFIFSGIGTSGFDATGQPLPATGFDFADFLLGLPQSSSIRFGSADTYFRGSMYNAYLQDEWRVRPNLTLNAGLRYEYQPPLTEKYNRMANLDIAPGFTAVAPVLPDGTGPYSGVFPRGLINPDRNNLGPRIGVAWKPVPNNSWLVRAGYGWYYNSAVYNQTAARLAQQPPFASSASINTSLARPLTLEDGFAASPTASILNTYAVNRAYRIGYAQTWSFSMQHDLPIGMVAEVGYLGTKGTRLDIQRLPNRSAPGSPLTAEQRRQIGNATGFIFDSSEGSSIYHAAQARLSRRFRRGLSANLMYTFSKSIDNASSFGGGGGNVVAQDDQNLRAERGLSSFDRRHTLNLFYVLTSPAGAGGAPVRGFTGRLLKDWTLSGGIALNSGTPFTATVLGNRSDTSGTGVVGSARADATGIPLELAHAFFNPAAFTLPPNGRFGNAARNTIPGPTSFVLNAAVGRAIRLDESRHSLELRFETSNTLNTVNITRIGTTINASNYDLPLAAGSMRTAQAVLRFRF